MILIENNNIYFIYLVATERIFFAGEEDDGPIVWGIEHM